MGRLGAAAVWDEFDRETSESELAAVPSCHGSVPNRYAAKAPCSAITIAIRNNGLADFSRADLGHFSGSPPGLVGDGIGLSPSMVPFLRDTYLSDEASMAESLGKISPCLFAPT